MMKSAEPKPEIRIILLYRGAFPLGDGGAEYEYGEVEGDPAKPDTWKLTERTRIYTKNLRRHAQPGTVFSIAVPDDPGNKVLLKTDKWLGIWPDEKQRLEWVAASRAREHVVREASRGACLHSTQMNKTRVKIGLGTDGREGVLHLSMPYQPPRLLGYYQHGRIRVLLDGLQIYKSYEAAPLRRTRSHCIAIVKRFAQEHDVIWAVQREEEA